jgi:hypothetical protein
MIGYVCWLVDMLDATERLAWLAKRQRMLIVDVGHTNAEITTLQLGILTCRSAPTQKLVRQRSRLNRLTARSVYTQQY